MPRKPRESSGTGIYHVMLRGINRQDIFDDTEDRQKDIVRDVMRELGASIDDDGANDETGGLRQIIGIKGRNPSIFLILNS